MARATQVAQAGLQGWRAKLADRVAEPLSRRTPLDEEQARALIGGVFFVLSVMYVVKAVRSAADQV